MATTEDGNINRKLDGPRELRVYSIDSVPDEIDELYDFRPVTRPVVDEDDAAPKDSSATTPADDSASTTNSEPTKEETVPVDTVKLPAKTAASKNGSQTS
jgi:hypothetical protein